MFWWSGNEIDNNCTKCKDNYLFISDSLYKNNCYERCQYFYYFNETNDYICTDNCSGSYDKLITQKNKCVDNCQNDPIYKYEYNKICYEQCPNGTNYSEIDGICIEIKNIETTFIINKDISSTSGTFFNSHISTILEKTTSLNEFIVTTGNFIKDIFNKTSLSTYIDGEAIENEKRSSSSYISEYSTFSRVTNTLTNIQNSIPISLINQAVISTNYKSYSNMEITQYISQNEFNYKTNFVFTGNNEDIYQDIIAHVIQNYDASKGKELAFQANDNFSFHITNSENELDALKGKNNSTNKFSVIDLGECENLLKNYYKINKNLSLIIMKFEKVTNISTERSLQYEVYEPNNKTKLNLSICNNLTIDIYVPVILSEKIQHLYDELKDMGYDLFDINSPFYQDICTPYKSNDGTDVPLNDRINYYYNNDETSCQANCKFSDYLIESQYLKCDCDITNSEINTQEATKFNAKSIYESFFSVLKYSNYKVLKCSKLTFTLNSITHNIGSIFTIIYFLVFFAFFLIFILKGIAQLKTEISKILFKNQKKKSIINQYI